MAMRVARTPAFVCWGCGPQFPLSQVMMMLDTQCVALQERNTKLTDQWRAHAMWRNVHEQWQLSPHNTCSSSPGHLSCGKGLREHTAPSASLSIWPAEAGMKSISFAFGSRVRLNCNVDLSHNDQNSRPHRHHGWGHQAVPGSFLFWFLHSMV